MPDGQYGHPLNLVVQTEGWATRPEYSCRFIRSISTAQSGSGVADACAATNHRRSADASPRRAAVALRAGIPVVTNGPIRPSRIGALSGHGIAGSSDVALVDGGAGQRRANTSIAKLPAEAHNAASAAV